MSRELSAEQASKKYSNLGPDLPTKYLVPKIIPLLWRIGYFFKLWTAKFLFGVLITLIKRKRRKNVSIQPSLVKSYACRPHLPVRIFLPKTDSTREMTRPKPLFIELHGGGFAIGDATLSDQFCAPWRDRTGMVVVSLNYSKSPVYQFPAALHDVATVARSIIEDSSLPIDKQHIIIGGCSAGGNLALTAPQLPELKGLVKAAVVWYPVVEWTIDILGKWDTRLSRELPYEPLALLSRSVDWGYVPAGHDREDPLLSPWYAKKEDLPPNICFVAAQNDFLCRESRDMAYALAGKDAGESDWKNGFEHEGYKFMMIEDESHGFVDDWVHAGEEKREKRLNDMYSSIDQWLRGRGFLE